MKQVKIPNHKQSKSKPKTELLVSPEPQKIRTMPKRAATEKKKQEDYLIPVALALKYENSTNKSKTILPKKRGRPKSLISDEKQTKITFTKKN